MTAKLNRADLIIIRTALDIAAIHGKDHADKMRRQWPDSVIQFEAQLASLPETLQRVEQMIAELDRE